MNTLHLKYAVEVERTGSITKAADNLYMGQPSLSKAIKELEDDLQIEIFRRSSKGMVPTEEGAQFLRYAKNILSQIDNMERISKGNSAGRGRISVCLPPAGYLLLAVSAFSREAAGNGSKLEVAELNSREILTRVAEGKSDFGVVRFPEIYEPYFDQTCRAKDLKMENIWNYRQVLVSSGEKEDIGKMTQVRCRDYLAAPGEWEEEIGKEEKVIEVTGLYWGLEMLSNNPMVYIKSEPLPRQIMERYGLVSRTFHEALAMKDVLIYGKDHKFTEPEQMLVNRIYEWKNKVLLE